MSAWSQMLAAAPGAQVYRSDTPEIGVHTVTLDPLAIDDPIWGVDPGEPDAVPTDFRVVQWHFDTFDLPAGARIRLVTVVRQSAVPPR